MANGPNYMPFMYFLMMPFAFLDWESAKVAFGLCNIALFVATIVLLYGAGVPRIFLWLMSILVLLGYTYGNVIGNAQSAIIVGFGVSLAYRFRHKPWVVVLGLSLVCIKHSFALPILLGFFLCGYYKEVLASALVAFGFVCLFGLKVGASPFEILHLLSEVNAYHYMREGAFGGPSDLMSLSQKLFGTPYSMLSLFHSLACHIWDTIIICFLLPFALRLCRLVLGSCAIWLCWHSFYGAGRACLSPSLIASIQSLARIGR